MNTRSNGNHVDLMRNAPIDAEKRPPWLVGGHRLHKHIPWYRGKKGDEMEPETLALCDFIENNLFTNPFNIVLDCHSGFGFEDRLWFPFAYSKKPIYHLSEIYALKRLLNQTYPHLNYVFEPQSKHYTAHGDLWDYLYLKSFEKNTIFLPLTMEMGSWRWVKKNPRQLASISGLFNPTIPHRLKRVLRQHIVLMEFLIRAVRSYQNWQPLAEKRAHLHSEAVRYWYWYWYRHTDRNLNGYTMGFSQRLGAGSTPLGDVSPIVLPKRWKRQRVVLRPTRCGRAISFEKPKQHLCNRRSYPRPL